MWKTEPLWSINKNMKNIENYRKKIDDIDFKIIELLAQRMKIVEEIGEWKRGNKISFFDQERYTKMLESRVVFAKKLNLNEDFVENIFQIIHKASLECEKKMNDPNITLESDYIPSSSM